MRKQTHKHKMNKFEMLCLEEEKVTPHALLNAKSESAGKWRTSTLPPQNITMLLIQQEQHWQETCHISPYILCKQ